jgi:hypothetical protein
MRFVCNQTPNSTGPMMSGWMLRRSLVALSLLMAGLLDPPAQATVLFPDAPTPTDYSSYNPRVDQILDITRGFHINPHAWNAWLAAQPRSKNIEDRRGEPPPTAIAAPDAPITAPLPKELQAQIDRGLEDYLQRIKKDPGLKTRLDRAYEDWANRNKEKKMSGRESQ